jgi:hypothetical protein
MGTWGTEVKQNTSVTQRGKYSLEFVSGQTGEMKTDYIPVITGQPYQATAWLRGTSIAAGNTCKADIEWYTVAKALVSSTNIHATAVLGAAATWEEHSVVVDAPATAAFAKVCVEKVAEASGWTLYCDDARIKPHPPCFSAYLNNDTSYANGATIVFDVEDFDHGANYNTANGRFTAPALGVYTFNAQSRFEDLGTNDYAQLGFKLNGTQVSHGTRIYVHDGASVNDDPHITLSKTIKLSASDYVEIIAQHDFGAARTVTGLSGSYKYSSFQGFRVE